MLPERTYKEWAAKDLWTFEEAIKLIIGHDPEFKLNGAHCRAELDLSQFEKNFDDVFEERNERYHEIEELVRRSLQAGTLEHSIMQQPVDFSLYNDAFDDDGIRVESEWASRICVEPKVFLAWAKNKALAVPASLVGNPIPTATPDYISPYLQYMLHASAELSITANDKRKKQEIVEWLEQHKPTELKLSANMLETMATFLRSPQAGHGGNKRI